LEPASCCTTTSRQVVVIFTGFGPEKAKIDEMTSIVEELGGKVSTSADECTHVVFEGGIAKTEKSLVALSRGCIFATTKWLFASKKAGAWKDSTGFMVKDARMEREVRFTLKESVAKAQHDPNAGAKLFQGLEVYATKSVAKGNHEAVRRIVEAAGASFTKREPGKTNRSSQSAKQLVIISQKEDLADARRLKKLPQVDVIYEWPAITTSLLRQELSLGRQNQLAV